MTMQFDKGPFNEDTELQKTFLHLKKKHGIKTVIETGTYHGTTTGWLAQHFEKVCTIEVNETYYKIALAVLAVFTNVKQYLGSSAEKLAEILCNEYTGEPLLVFLDAHWYANPLLGELEAIAACGIKPVLVIHDFYNPNHPDYGFDIYPDQKITYNWAYVSPVIEKIYGAGGYQYFYNDKATGAKRGALFVVPLAS